MTSGRGASWAPSTLVDRLAARSRAEVGALVRAQWALVVAQLIVWTRPVGRLVSDAAHDEVSRRPPNREAIRLARSVRQVGRYGLFRPRCLVRSVAIQRVLSARGIHGSYIRIGVRRAGDRFAAHAWVELDGRVIGDDARSVGAFTRLLDVRTW